MPYDEGSTTVHPEQPSQEPIQQPIQHVTNITTVNNTIVHKNQTLEKGGNEASEGTGRQENKQATSTKNSAAGKP